VSPKGTYSHDTSGGVAAVEHGRGHGDLNEHRLLGLGSQWSRTPPSARDEHAAEHKADEEGDADQQPQPKVHQAAVRRPRTPSARLCERGGGRGCAACAPIGWRAVDACALAGDGQRDARLRRGVAVGAGEPEPPCAAFEHTCVREPIVRERVCIDEEVDGDARACQRTIGEQGW
jgi:hypothetical protein